MASDSSDVTGPGSPLPRPRKVTQKYGGSRVRAARRGLATRPSTVPATSQDTTPPKPTLRTRRQYSRSSSPEALHQPSCDLLPRQAQAHSISPTRPTMARKRPRMADQVPSAPAIRRRPADMSDLFEVSDDPLSQDAANPSSAPMMGSNDSTNAGSSQSQSQSQPQPHSQLHPTTVSSRMQARPKDKHRRQRFVSPFDSSSNVEAEVGVEPSSDAAQPDSAHASQTSSPANTPPRRRTRRVNTRLVGPGRTYGSQRAFLVDLPPEATQNASTSSMGLHSSLGSRAGVSFALPSGYVNRAFSAFEHPALPAPSEAVPTSATSPLANNSHGPDSPADHARSAAQSAQSVDAMLGVTQLGTGGVQARASYKELLARWGEGEMSGSEEDEGRTPTQEAKATELQSLTSLRSAGASRLFRDQLAYMLAELKSAPAHRSRAAIDLATQLFPEPEVATSTEHVATGLPPVPEGVPVEEASGFLDDLTSSGLVRAAWSAFVQARIFPGAHLHTGTSSRTPAVHPATAAEQYDASTIDAALVIFVTRLLAAPPSGTRARRARALLFGDPKALELPALQPQSRSTTKGKNATNSQQSQSSQSQSQCQCQPQCQSQTLFDLQGDSLPVEDQPLAPDEQLVEDLLSVHTSRGPLQLDVLDASQPGQKNSSPSTQLRQLASSTVATPPGAYCTTRTLVLLATTALVPHLSARGMIRLTDSAGLADAAIEAYADHPLTPTGTAEVDATVSLLLALHTAGEFDALTTLTQGHTDAVVFKAVQAIQYLLDLLRECQSQTKTHPSCNLAKSAPSINAKGTAPARSSRSPRSRGIVPLTNNGTTAAGKKKKALSTSRVQVESTNAPSLAPTPSSSSTAADTHALAVSLSAGLNHLKVLTTLVSDEGHKVHPAWFGTELVNILVQLATYWPEPRDSSRTHEDGSESIAHQAQAQLYASVSEAACAATELLSLLVQLHGVDFALLLLPALDCQSTRTSSPTALAMLHDTFIQAFGRADSDHGGEQMDAALAGLRAGCTAVLLTRLLPFSQQDSLFSAQRLEDLGAALEALVAAHRTLGGSTDWYDDASPRESGPGETTSATTSSPAETAAQLLEQVRAYREAL